MRIIFLLTLIFTISMCFIQPKMHPQIFVYNSDYKLIEPEKPEIQKVEIPTDVKVNITETKKLEPVKNIKAQKEITIETQNSKKNITNTKQETVRKIDSFPVAKKEIIKTELKKESNIISQQEQEELIAWNKWHSNIQNNIMQDSKLPYLPEGIIFRFNFTVDKYGKIYDIKTWSDNPQYSIYAIQYIAPVIKSYQGKSILNFPKNSQRVTTQFNGKFKTAHTGENKYSSESDFNDMEKIRK